jgi:glutamate-1-semialdehyde 2,1-aminomutase
VAGLKKTVGTGQQLYKRAQKLIPGGTQLLSKRPEMFLPELWPSYFAKAKGAKVWDLDNNCYIDATHFGVGAPVLGFADPDVDRAVINAIQTGTACTLNCPEEVRLAELLIELHPWAEMVRFARGGGEVMAIAARIARAATGRDRIAVCGYHGWHDWYLAANLSEDGALDGHLLPGLQPAGVPRGLTSTVVTFRYNDFQELESVAANHGERLAAIIMEPTRNEGPAPRFLEKVRAIADKCGAVLVFDEVTSGWRVNTGGAHLTLGVMPDMAAFAKAMGNGYAMAAVIGKRSVMDAAQSTFISSTMWTERIGPAAALATICKHRSHSVPAHLVRIGERVQRGWREAAQDARLKLHVTGIAPLSHFGFEHEEPLTVATLFIQGMLDRGYLAATSFYSSLAHTDAIIDGYLSAVRETFGEIAKAVDDGSVREHLRGPVKHGGFSRLN